MLSSLLGPCRPTDSSIHHLGCRGRGIFSAPSVFEQDMEMAVFWPIYQRWLQSAGLCGCHATSNQRQGAGAPRCKARVDESHRAVRLWGSFSLRVVRAMHNFRDALCSRGQPRSVCCILQKAPCSRCELSSSCLQWLSLLTQIKLETLTFAHGE